MDVSSVLSRDSVVSGPWTGRILPSSSTSCRNADADTSSLGIRRIYRRAWASVIVLREMLLTVATWRKRYAVRNLGSELRESLVLRPECTGRRSSFSVVCAFRVHGILESGECERLFREPYQCPSFFGSWAWTHGLNERGRGLRAARLLRLHTRHSRSSSVGARENEGI